MTTQFLETMETKLNTRNIKQITINGYMNGLRNLRINVKSTSKTIKFFKRTDKIKVYLDSVENLNTRKNILKPILNLLKDEPKLQDTYQFYYLINKDLVNKINKKIGENKFTKKETKNKITWLDVINIKPEGLDEKIYHSLLVNDNVFIRLEHFNIKLDEYDEKTDNYIDGPFLFMNSFKNVKSFGPHKINLSDETTDIIENIRGSWLVSNHGISQSGRGKWITRFFKKRTGKSVNNNLLRKIYINHVLKSLPNITNNQITERAKKMLNSKETWINTYRKVN